MTITEEKQSSLPTAEEFLRFQASYNYCQESIRTVGIPNSKFTYDLIVYLVLNSLLCGSLQCVVPVALQPMILALGHYSVTSGHPGCRSVYDTLRQYFFWSHMHNYVHTTNPGFEQIPTHETSFPTDSNGRIPSPQLKLQLLARLQMMRIKVDHAICQAQDIS